VGAFPWGSILSAKITSPREAVMFTAGLAAIHGKITTILHQKKAAVRHVLQMTGMVLIGA